MNIVRGYIIPKRGKNNNPVYIEELSSDDGKSLLNAFCELIEEVVRNYTDNGGKKLKTSLDVNNFLDSFILYLKSQLYLDPLPDIILSPMDALYFYFKYKGKLRREDMPYYSWESLIRYKDILNRIMISDEKLFQPRHSLILRILSFPADTRPASNTSSLLIHMLTTSAMASSLYIGEYGCEDTYNLAIVRVTSIFHDLGKFLDWRRHKSISARKVHELFKKYVESGSEAEEIINKSSSIIEEKEISELTYFRNILEKSDRLASGIDRVIWLLPKLLDESLKNELLNRVNEFCGETMVREDEKLYKAFTSWKFWEKFVGDELIKKLTLNFCMNASKISPENPVIKESLISVNEEKKRKALITDEISVVRLDLRKIQAYIKSNDIRAMNGASRIIDFIGYVAIPLYLMNQFTLPAETILYFGGGNLTLIMPSNKVSEIQRLKEHFQRCFNISITTGFSPLYRDFSLISREIDESILKEKLTSLLGDVSPNIFQLCLLCEQKYAVDYRREKYICTTCKRKLEVGDGIHFKARVTTKKLKSIIKVEWEKLRDHILEYIAGHPLDELCNGKVGKYRSLALIKFDGNLMSEIMASSISITDAFERSVRIDYGVKQAFIDFLEMIKGKNEDDFCRLSLGLMYLGGDDGAVMMPSPLAIPFALHLANEFYLHMGCKATLSFGIAVAKPKHPIIQLYESADYLLRTAKKGARSLDYRENHSVALEKPSSKFRGCLSFLSADGGTMTREALRSVLEQLSKEGISSQEKFPYTISNTKDPRSILRLIRTIYSNGLSLGNLSMEEFASWVISTNSLNKLRKLRNLLNKVLQVNILGDSDLKIRVIFALRESRTEVDAREIKEILDELYIPSDKPRFNLYDLYQLIEVLEGGR